MSGVRLEAKVHMVIGAESAAQNIVKCVQRCGLQVEDIVLDERCQARATVDHEAVSLFLDTIDLETAPIPGTALADALETATGAVLLHTIGDRLGRIVPVLKDAQIKYTAPAVGVVSGSPSSRRS